jgi:omega-6 fatty acid desaturase (delta-12 desaturase)
LTDAAHEATAALKEFLGPHYHRSEENMFVSLWKNYRECQVRGWTAGSGAALIRATQYIDPSQDVQFYKNAAGLAQRVGVDETGALSDSGIDMADAK